MRIQFIDPKITSNLRHYVLQVSLATFTLMVVIWTGDLVAGANVARAVLVGAIASTAFVLFISPHSDAAGPRHVLGGHAIGLLVAFPFAIFSDRVVTGLLLDNISLLFGMYAAGAVGLSMLAMAATNAEHAPAAGTALAMVVHGLDVVLVAFISIAVLSLTFVHLLLRKWMINLY